MFKLAELFVDIKARDANLKAQLADTRQNIGAWGVAAGTAIGSLAAQAIGAATSSIAGFFAKGISGAVGLQETISKVNAVFGDAAGTIISRADEMAAKYGVVKQEYLDAASSFGAAFKSAGLAAGEAAEIGNKIADLGMDMASFGNAGNAEVFTAISAALRGESDPIERFGVRLSAAKIEAEALSSGLARNKNEVTDLAKQQATLNLIMRETKDQQGDLERTADGSANQWRRLTGTFTNMAVELGGKLEPALNSLLKVGNGLIDSLGPGIEWLGGMFAAFADGVVEAVEVVGVMWRNLGSVWEIVTIQARQMFANVVAGATALAEDVGILAGWIGRNWYQLIADGFNATVALFRNFGENLGNLAYAVFEFLSDPTAGFQFDWKPLLDGFEATVEALPELARPAWVDLQEEIDQVGREIADREGERAAKIEAARKKPEARPDGGAAAAAARTDWKSEMLGAADYAFKLRATLTGGDDTAKKQLAAAEKTEKNTARIADAADRKPVAAFG